MKEQKKAENWHPYASVVADTIEIGRLKVDSIGFLAFSNNVSELLLKLGRYHSNEFLSSFYPMWSLIYRSANSLLDRLTTYIGARRVINALDIDEGTKLGLCLDIENTYLSDLTGRGGHIIELKKLQTSVPAISDLPLEIQEKILTGLRKEHQLASRKEVLVELELFFDNIIKSLRDFNLEEMVIVMKEENARLYSKIIEMS